MTKQEFIEKAREIHGDKYDYKMIQDESLEPYTSVPIICNEHGLFWQSVYRHLSGIGCFECNRKDRN